MPPDKAALRKQLLEQRRRALQVIERQVRGQLINSFRRQVNYQVNGVARRQMVRTYGVSLQNAYGAGLAESVRGVPDRTVELLLKGVNEIERATIGVGKVAQRDNVEIAGIMQSFATTVNDSILSTYLSSFSGRSYRVGDPSRRSGEVEAFLRRGTVAQAVGTSVEVSLKDAVGDSRVPHIFRLNYGTKSLKGGEKAGFGAPVVQISLFQGVTSTQSLSDGNDRRPGFYYPGKRFGHRLVLGGAGEVRLYRTSDTRSDGALVGAGLNSRPSRGIAPSHFIERGIADAMSELPVLHGDLLTKWKRRVERIRDTGGNLT